jgi:nucleoside-diphosphate-sugar epimerase
VTAGLVPATVGQAVNVARGREVSIKDLARAVARACGRPEIAPSFDAPRPADVRRHLAATQKAEKIMGYRADTDLEAGLARYVAWVRSRGAEVSVQEARSRNW